MTSIGGKINSSRFICMLATLASFLSGATALADANDGEYLGYRLGDIYDVPKKATSREHILGARIFDLNPGQHGHHVDAISIYVSPTSSIIGSIFGEWYFSTRRSAERFASQYLTSLGRKYDDWTLLGHSLTNENYRLSAEVEQKPLIVENWPSSLQFRVLIGLIYAPDSLSRSEWMALVHMEVNDLQLTASQ
jgi:hypothetical protein